MTLQEVNPFEYKEDVGYTNSIGYVYFIHAHELNRIKIGITVRPIKQRLDELQTGSPTLLSLIAYSSFQNPLLVEERLHRMFNMCRVRIGGKEIGEWFHAEDLLYGFIWNFADRISSPSYFPSRIMKSDKKIKEMQPMLSIKGLLYEEDYITQLGSTQKQISKTIYTKYDRITGKTK